MGLKVGINAEKANDAHTGIGQYAANLMTSMAALENPHKYYAYFYHQTPASDPVVDSLRSSGAIVRLGGHKNLQNRRRILWEQFVLPRLAAKDRVDVFHYLDNALSLPFLPFPAVITVHDLCFYRRPEAVRPRRRAYKRLVGDSSMARATRIICPSQSTKQDILEFTETDPDKIDVIYYGLHPRFRPIEDPGVLERFRVQRGLPPDFLLYVGAIEPRKNLRMLLEAFKESGQAASIPLILCGSRGWKFDELERRIDRLGLSGRVFFIGPLSNEVLPLLYNLATAVVYPSVCEGFGLPPVEAMACGTAVIVSASGSLPEITGKGALWINDDDLTKFSLAITKIISDKTYRGNYAKAGLTRSGEFNWKRAAILTQKCYEKALSGK